MPEVLRSVTHSRSKKLNETIVALTLEGCGLGCTCELISPMAVSGSGRDGAMPHELAVSAVCLLGDIELYIQALVCSEGCGWLFCG